MLALLLFLLTVTCCQSTPGMDDVDYTDMGSYQHGMQINFDTSTTKEILNQKQTGDQTKDQEVQVCFKTDDRAAKFYKRLVGSLLTQMQIRSRTLNPGEVLTLDLRAEVSAVDLATLQEFIQKETRLGEDLDDSYKKVDSILTSLLEVSSAPKYMEFMDYVQLQLRKWTSAETFNILIIIFFILVFAKIFSFLLNAKTVLDTFKLVLGFVCILTMFVVILESQGYVLWRSLPTDAVSRVFSSVGFRYLEDLIDSISNNISKEFYFPSAVQPFVKILVWPLFMIFWIFVLLLFSMVVVLLFTVREIFSRRIRTWFGVIEPVQQQYQPPAVTSEIQGTIQGGRRPQIVDNHQIVRVVTRKPKIEIRNIETQTEMSMCDLDGEAEFVEFNEDFAIAED
ncbi:unnamed protein product [Allacma fusca]|uniref:Chloride channel CLIC-like protein 1 n=1 Tax=Allacma fusca TaxID=39272 RepID=A0A8J2PHX6_9HEXA|nr:unnamed protein product [Allacma fusca]